jgi:hypothetical protein
MKNKTIVFGIGEDTLKACHNGILNIRDVSFFVVSNLVNREREFMRKPIMDLNGFLEHENGEEIVIVSDDYASIYKLFKNIGTLSERLSAYIDCFYSGSYIVRLTKNKKPKYINIGGGFRFYHDGWLNLDSSK